MIPLGIRVAMIALMACHFIVNAAPGSSQSYETLLSRYVCNKGVAYEPLKNDPLLKTARDEFESIDKGHYLAMTNAQRLAYLINSYNFFTLELIANHYPTESIRDIPRAWKREFVPFLGEKVSLDHIEHEIIRKKFDEPRIHFALVCASTGCPALPPDPFTADSLDAQLTAAAKQFLTDTTKNRIDGTTLRISKIFEWYGEDFEKIYGGFVPYIKKTLGLKGDFRVKYLDYDWSLNEVSRCD